MAFKTELCQASHSTKTSTISSPEQLQEVPSLPGSLDESLKALEDDHEFLLKGDVFTPQLIERWISYKREREIQPLRLRPHPLEFGMYFDI
jgi:glutamine synthetase